MSTTGRITKTHGYQGAVVVKSRGGIITEPKQGEPVFIVIDGIPVPFFTREAYSSSPDTLIISFDDYLTAESVSHLQGCHLLSTGDEADGDELQALSGYTIVDRSSGESGTITEILTYPGQLLAVTLIGEREIFIPLHPDLIVSVDHSGKSIVMELPQGLTGLDG